MDNNSTRKLRMAPGIEKAPEAFRGLLRGENLGKQLVAVAEEE